MAPKTPSHYRQPSKEEENQEEPSHEEKEEEEEEEEEEPEEELEAESSKEEKENSSDEIEEGSSEDEEEEEDQQDGLDSPSDYDLQLVPKLSKSSRKRTNQENHDTHYSLRKRKKSRTEEKKSLSTPSGCITRLWSDEDEISLLNGMIDFKKRKGLEPNADMGAFYNFIKGKLQGDFSRDQFKTKIRKIKRRFLNALKKDDPVFSKPHEDMLFELSKKRWGGAVSNGGGSKHNENGKKDIVKADEKEIVRKEKVGEEGDFWSKYRFLGRSFDNMAGNFPSLRTSDAGMSFLKEKLSLIGDLKAKELDEKCQQLIVEETELNHRMLTLLTELLKLALDGAFFSP